MSGEADTIAKAREIYNQLQNQALAASPLAEMDSWLSGGVVPKATHLRDAGLRCDSERQDIRLARRAFIRRWGFSIPCEEAVTALRQLGPIVEIGAGTGYWTALLRAAGHDVIATDLLRAGEEVSEFSVGRHAEVEALPGVGAVRKYQDRDVLCSWPSEGDAWAQEAAQGVGPGRSFALIGDGRGGCTGTDGLFDVLDAAFDIRTEIQIPQFPRIMDRLTIYRRTT